MGALGICGFPDWNDEIRNLDREGEYYGKDHFRQYL